MANPKAKNDARNSITIYSVAVRKRIEWYHYVEAFFTLPSACAGKNSKKPHLGCVFLTRRIVMLWKACGKVTMWKRNVLARFRKTLWCDVTQNGTFGFLLLLQLGNSFRIFRRLSSGEFFFGWVGKARNMLIW